MNYSDIKYSDMINGEGIRVSLFVSGCTHKCEQCFNRDTWDENYGKPFTETEKNEIFEYFRKYKSVAKGISLLGGDPTYIKNVAPLVEFLKEFKKEFPDKDVWMWTGFTWEVLLKDKERMKLVELCDVIIDGKFEIEKKDLNLKWRGSSNQRVIKVKNLLNNTKS